MADHEHDGMYRIEHRPDHAYTCPEGMKGCKAINTAGNPCNKAKMHPDHHLPTLNLFGSGNRFAYQNAKKHWSVWLTAALIHAQLPRGLDSVLVEGQLCFPTHNAPDQGNHRYFIEKALGDVLETGGWLAKDDWDHYEFGNLARVVRPGERWLSLVLMPNALITPAQGQLAL
ncbi:hypothetical protein DSM104299_03206 [Baekduia alba]|uniref:hypothetical protein n=1 Tax=Baekduia alba TaxID=2997333 RepID=UPI0023409CA1|nr:hypothetical protein [Baekduia alba]WCB94469.1 hypothetical protein DSM104299_03206 [Baekduia alba]